MVGRYSSKGRTPVLAEVSVRLEKRDRIKRVCVLILGLLKPAKVLRGECVAALLIIEM